MELTLEERVYRLEVALRLHAPTIEKNVDYGDILLTILERYSGKKRAELTGKNRWRQNVYIRQIGMNLLMDYTDMSLTAIGLVFGGRDHSTVIYAREQHHEVLIDAKPKNRADQAAHYDRHAFWQLEHTRRLNRRKIQIGITRGPQSEAHRNQTHERNHRTCGLEISAEIKAA